ncbi:MAG: isochorismatase family protein [Chloroflexota bacterium]
MNTVSKNLTLPARLTGDHEDITKHITLNLDVAKTAFLLVDCDDVNTPGDPVDMVIKQTLAPTLATVRSVGMKVVFLHGGGHDDSHSIKQERHLFRTGTRGKPRPWVPSTPKWVANVEPEYGDPVIEKNGQSGFRETSLDFCLRTNGIETLLRVGFSFKSCLFYTMVDAAQLNYRVIFLRDGTHPLGENEFRDTVDETLAEKGWVRLVLTRLFEDHWGYSAMCADLITGCERLNKTVKEKGVE